MNNNNYDGFFCRVDPQGGWHIWLLNLFFLGRYQGTKQTTRPNTPSAPPEKPHQFLHSQLELPRPLPYTNPYGSSIYGNYTYVYTSGGRYASKVHCREALDPTWKDFTVYMKPTRGLDDRCGVRTARRRIGERPGGLVYPSPLNSSSSSTRRGNSFLLVTAATSINKTLSHRSLV